MFKQAVSHASAEAKDWRKGSQRTITPQRLVNTPRKATRATLTQHRTNRLLLKTDKHDMTMMIGTIALRRRLKLGAWQQTWRVGKAPGSTTMRQCYIRRDGKPQEPTAEARFQAPEPRCQSKHTLKQTRNMSHCRRQPSPPQSLPCSKPGWHLRVDTMPLVEASSLEMEAKSAATPCSQKSDPKGGPHRRPRILCLHRLVRPTWKSSQ